MKSQKEQQPSFQPSQTPQAASQFASRPFDIQPQQDSISPSTPQQIEDETFQQQKFEATQLQLKQQAGSITPQQQERLGVLQAKMDGLLTQRLERASQFGHHLADIAIHPPTPATPIQTKLTIGR
ncbi:MAG: hypothetical protein F6K32_19185 [Desertifilum sp. SIO1I2]|nr:hypothetical protein [Desertifilum sp. SIO1I2]